MTLSVLFPSIVCAMEQILWHKTIIVQWKVSILDTLGQVEVS